MAREARVTNIQTGAERSAGQPGQRYDENVANMLANLQAKADKAAKESAERGDKTYGPTRDGGYNPPPRRFSRR